MITVAGVGETTYTTRSGRSVQSLAVEAARSALGDAGVSHSAIDGIVPLGGLFAEDVIIGCGLSTDAFEAAPPPGGNAAMSALVVASAMIMSGQATAVLVVLARNGASQHRIADRVRSLPGQQLRTQLEHPHGWSTPAQWYAMICRRHMHEYGTTKSQLASVALAMREHAQRNPRAMLRGRPLTMRDYLDAPMIADPYQRFDCCLETDGAAAVLLLAGDHPARDARRSVPILGAATARPPSPDDLTNRQDWFEVGLTAAAPSAFDQAAVAPTDIDAAMIYDCFTFEVIHQLEEAGFCPRGEGGRFVASGALGLGGDLPVNTHGGLLAEGHLGGLNHVIEAVRQLRNEAGARQVDGARLVAVSGWGDWGDGSLAILGSPSAA